jgi:hypothetical protein
MALSILADYHLESSGVSWNRVVGLAFCCWLLISISHAALSMVKIDLRKVFKTPTAGSYRDLQARCIELP